MKESIISFLSAYKKKTIPLGELEAVSFQEKMSYEQFSTVILELEEEGILSMVAAHGRSLKTPSLAYTYRLHSSKLKEQLFSTIQQARVELHEQIDVDPYFRLRSDQFERDLPFLHKISAYLETSSGPSYPVPAPERSFELVGNEKWITEDGGEECLKRIGLWETMQIIPIADPLMVAIDGRKMGRAKHFHLIVENKTTYQGLLPALESSIFTTLVLGYGRKIVKGIEHFHQQVLLEGKHEFYYFGDLDAEGISIWHSLSERVSILLAMPFYTACLQHVPVYGKMTQRRVDKAIDAFVSHFSPNQQKNIATMIQTNHYLPQEVLKTKKLQTIWRDWRDPS